jgi:hypothetical protein
MWLIANDIIIGIAVGSFFVHNNDYVSNVVHDTLKVLISHCYWCLFSQPF